jgi:hypothetical protein
MIIFSVIPKELQIKQNKIEYTQMVTAHPILAQKVYRQMEPYLTSPLYQAVIIVNRPVVTDIGIYSINCGVSLLSHPLQLCKYKCTVKFRRGASY